MAEPNKGAKQNAPQQKPNGSEQDNGGAVSVNDSNGAGTTSAATVSIRRGLARTLGHLVMVPILRKEHNLSHRNAIKLLDEMERNRPSIWEDACAASGIEIGTDPTKAGEGGTTGAIFDGHIMNWLLDPANQQKIMAFGQFLATFVKVLLPLFGG